MHITDITRNTAPADQLSLIRKPILMDLEATNQCIIRELVSDVPLIQEITQHIIKSGGKRLRPLLVLLSARACGYQGNDGEHHELATIIEFVHTATLLHDDVIDESNLRRGHQTANAVWGNSASVLVGDFLYSRAFQILARRSNIPVMTCLANTTNAIAQGEVWQLMNQHNPDITEEDYTRVIKNKTATLFEAATEIGALLTQQPESIQHAMAEYGLNLGMGFQIIDDLLDYSSHADTLGKNVGDDLAEGKVTLPLIVALQRSNETQKHHIQQAIIHGRIEDLPTILSALKDTQAIEYTLEQAKHYAEQARNALQPLPDSSFRQSMMELISFVVERNY